MITRRYYKQLIFSALVLSAVCSVLILIKTLSLQSTFLLLLLIVLISSFSFVIIFLHISFTTPFRLISESLNTNSTDPIRPLLKTQNPFSSIATLIVQSFNQNKSLLHEINQRKKAQSTLKEKESLYRTLIETSPDAIILFDESGKIVFYNSTASSLLGFELSSGPNEHFKFMEPLQLNILVNDVKACNEKRIRAHECSLCKANGISFPAEISISLIEQINNEETRFIGIVRDISNRKEMENEKNKIEQQFRAAQKMEAIGQLAGGISHDFNNILGAISGYADILKHQYHNDEKLSKYADMILTASTRAADLTRKLLTFARRGKLQFCAIDMHEMIEETVDLLRHTTNKQVNIRCHYDTTEAVIKGDPAQIQSAIVNVAVNAFDAMPEGGNFEIKTEVCQMNEDSSKSKVYAVTPGRYLKLTLKDNGAGIDTVTQSKIFEPFFTTKPSGKGTGLGLSSVYGTVKSHNGYIEVESEPGCGASFTILLPAVSELPSSLNHSDEKISNHCCKQKIMIIDDESSICNALKEMLSWMGYSVCVFCDGYEAIDYYKLHSNEIDLIILDLMMPGLSGKECYRRLRNINQSVKVIISSGNWLENEREELLCDGIKDILQKPFLSSQLAKSIQKVFGDG
ncbi:response regulator [Chitinispirillales bacterium ANBcel5]|uniref:hybrid sensor histidine kinase/response regulator n=1 Tax=Cellulosispirillum alkaliphilum TaxID=3039283 RepID=UPI002A5883B3|nr:response regulator [Chitinispirillales bacterium ANBcel5]